MRSVPTVQLREAVEVVMVRRPAGAPARACDAVSSEDKDDPERGKRAAKRRATRRREKRHRFMADAEIAALRGETT